MSTRGFAPGAWLRAALWIAAGTALFGVAPSLLFARQVPLAIDFATDPPRRLVSGLYPVESDPTGLTFVWTRPSFGLTIPGLDRGIEWRLAMRLAASRPDGSRPAFAIDADGATVARGELPSEGFVDREITIPPRTEAPRTTVISMRVEPPYVPAGDPRELGAQLDRITLSPMARPSLQAPWPPRLLAGVVAGVLAAIAAVPASVAALWLLITAVAFGLLATHGSAPYVGVPWVQVLIVSTAVAAVAAAMLPRERRGAAAAVLITFTGALVQMLLLFHPEMPLGDALFHAHRFQDVLAGHYYFTSVAPGNYVFPYPIGLYLASAPFARFTRSALENAALLRTVVVVANAIGAALLYRAARRWRPEDEVSAGSAVAAYVLAPLSFGVIGTGNLTNAFAQSLAMATLAAVAWLMPATRSHAGDPEPVRHSAWPAAIIVFVLAAAGFLSHTSTFAVLAVQLLASSVLLLLSREPARRAGVILLATTVAALIVSIAVYYGHFVDTYREALTRIAAETGRATEAAGGRTPLTRLVEAPAWLVLYYGVPVIAATAIGLAALSRPHTTNRVLSRVITGWLLAALLFLAVGIVTPVDMRHHYAALPSVALIAGVGISWLWRSGAWGASAAILLSAWALWVAWRESVVRFLS